MKSKFKFILFLSIVFSLSTHCQNEQAEEHIIVKSFVEDVFINNKLSEEVYTAYAKEGIDIEIFKKHIDKIKSDKKHLLNKDISFNTQNYSKSSLPNLQKFDKSVINDIFIITVDDKIEFYILLQKSRIVSFDYLQKGAEGPAYFVIY